MNMASHSTALRTNREKLLGNGILGHSNCTNWVFLYLCYIPGPRIPWHDVRGPGSGCRSTEYGDWSPEYRWDTSKVRTNTDFSRRMEHMTLFVLCVPKRVFRCIAKRVPMCVNGWPSHDLEFQAFDVMVRYLPSVPR